ncbi:transglutaminase domain-containing protein [bacterium]|nr:transglutaminase domain-containing protein [bacterium]
MLSKRRDRWRRLKPFVAAAILLWWGAMIFLLVKRTRGPAMAALPDFNIVETGDLVSDNYYSITFQGKKIGYNRVAKRILPSGTMFQETSYYKLPVGGVEQEITSEGLMTVDDSLRMKMMTFDFSGGGYKTTVNAALRNGVLDVEIKTPSGSRRTSYPYEGALYTSTIIPELLKMRGFRRGRFELPTFDPMTASARTYSLHVIGKDRLKRFGDKEVWEVRLMFGPIQTAMFIDTSGTLLMEKTPEGFMSVLEEKKKALRFDAHEGGGVDFLAEFSLPLGGEVIENPRDAVRFEMRIKGLQAGLFDLDDFNQSWDADSEILTVDSRGLHRDSLFPKIVPNDTAEAMNIQCHDRRIVAAAEKITKGANSDTERLIAINDYLYKKMSKQTTVSIPSAVDVLRKMRGDCNEHTTLFVALARSLGIPARTNVGLLYMDGYFYYHAWPQAFADGRWQSFDATLGQHPVDATHIKLTSGGLDQMLALLRFGNARMSFVEIDYKGKDAKR